MRTLLLIVLILAFGFTAADAHRRGHHQYHRQAYPPLHVGTPSEAAVAGSASARRAPDAGQSSESAAKQTLNEFRGPLHIIVSIRDQRLTLYRNGVPVAHSKISTGTIDHPTPTGVFSVIQKERWHRSNLYSLAPMPYMQRITWSGIALHAGVVPRHPASHGCIRLPTEFAKLLWSTTKIGARVVVAPTAITPIEITHPRLAELARSPTTDGLATRDWRGPGSANAMDATTPEMARTAADVISNPSAASENTNSPAPTAQNPPRTGELVSVLVSRKAGRLFVRAGFQPLFDSPVTIRQQDIELGTHVFTAMESPSDSTAMRWVAVTMPNVSTEPDGRRKRDGENPFRHPQTEGSVSAHAPTAIAALDRIEMPPDAIARISELLSPGASLIISDQGISTETGRGTDFVVLAPGQKSQAGQPTHRPVR